MEKKIKEMADKLAKSFEEQENLKEFKQLVEEIGKENVSEFIKSLPEESQAQFKATLEKSLSMDKEAQEKTGAKVKQVVSEDARSEEDEEAKKRREADKGEKMVKKPGADKISHQGDNTELPGQVIKSEDEPTDLEKGKECPKEEIKEEAKKVAEKEMKEHNDTMHKSDLGKDEKEIVNGDVEKGAFKEAAIEELNKGELLHKMIEKMRQRGMDHDKVMDALGKKGYDVEMAKGKWEEMQKMDDEMAKKEVKKSEEVVAEAPVEAAPETPVEEPVQKSINWASPNERLEVNAKRGHNAHYNVDEYISKGGERAEKAQADEALAKSEEGKEAPAFDPNNVNDILEKGYDRSEDQVKQAIGHVKKPEGGQYNTSSFDDIALAKSFGMTVEEMNEVLGSPKPKAQ